MGNAPPCTAEEYKKYKQQFLANKAELAKIKKEYQKQFVANKEELEKIQKKHQKQFVANKEKLEKIIQKHQKQFVANKEELEKIKKEHQQLKKTLQIKKKQKNQYQVRLIGEQNIRKYALFINSYNKFKNKKDQDLLKYFKQTKKGFIGQIQKQQQIYQSFQDHNIQLRAQNLKNIYQENYKILTLEIDYKIFIKKYNLDSFKQKICQVVKNTSKEFDIASQNAAKKSKEHYLNIKKKKENLEEIQKLELLKETLINAQKYIQINKNNDQIQKYLEKIFQDQEQCNKKIQQQLNVYQNIKNKIKNSFLKEIQKIKETFQAQLTKGIKEQFFTYSYNQFKIKKDKQLKNYFGQAKKGFIGQIQKQQQIYQSFQDHNIQLRVQSLKNIYQENYKIFTSEICYKIFIKKYNLDSFKQKIYQVVENTCKEFSITSQNAEKKSKEHYLNIKKKKENLEEIQKLKLLEGTLINASKYIQINKNNVQIKKYVVKILQDQEQCNKKIQQQLNIYQNIKNMIKNSFLEEIQKIKKTFQAQLNKDINEQRHNPSHQVKVIRKQMQISTKQVIKRTQFTQCIYQNCSYDHQQIIKSIKKKIQVSQTEYAELQVESFMHINTKEQKQNNETQQIVNELNQIFNAIATQILNEQQEKVFLKPNSPFLNNVSQIFKVVKKSLQ